MNALEQIVPDGYKQTDVGVIPNDWESINFGELFEQSISRKPIKASDPVTFIGMQDVSESAQLTTPQQRVFEQIKTGFTYFEKNDVLVAKITPCFENGKGCYTDKITTRFGFGSTEFHVLRTKENSDAKFIYFWTTRNSLRQDLEGEMVGSAGHRRVPFSAIQNYLIPCPSSRIEQAAIANALSDVDVLLTELEKLIAKKQAIKTATMQQLLTGKTRLPQFATYTKGAFEGKRKGTKSSELGEIPEDWDVVELGDKTTFVGSGKTSTKEKGDFPLYGSTGQIGTCKNGDYKGDSLLIARVGANAGTLNFISGNYGVSDNTIIIKLKKDEDIFFYKYLLIRNNLNSLVFGSGQPLITGSQLKSLKVVYPNQEEQTAIATILSDMDNEIQTLEQRLTKTRQIKQGMMQQLLTGRTRLPY